MCAFAVCGGEEEVETQIRKPAGERDSANAHKRAHRAREYSTRTGLLRCPADLSDDGSKGRAPGKEEGALSGLKMPMKNGRAEE